MIKITAGFFWNEKYRRKEYIITHLPARMHIVCHWCGNVVENTMHLIKQEHDYDLLEEEYSARCSCNCKPRKL